MSLESSVLSIILLLYLGSLDLIISIENLSARIVTQHGEKKTFKENQICVFSKKKKRCEEWKNTERNYAWSGFSKIGLNLVG